MAEDSEGQSPEEKANAEKADKIADEEAKKNQVSTTPPANPEDAAEKAAEEAGKVDTKAVGPPEESDLKK